MKSSPLSALTRGLDCKATIHHELLISGARAKSETKPRSRLHTSASLSRPLNVSVRWASSSPAAQQRSACEEEEEEEEETPSSSSSFSFPPWFFSNGHRSSSWIFPLIRPACHRLTEIQAGVGRQRDLSEEEGEPHSCRALRRPADRTIWLSGAPWKDTRLIRKGPEEVRLRHVTTLGAVQMWTDEFYLFLFFTFQGFSVVVQCVDNKRNSKTTWSQILSDLQTHLQHTEHDESAVLLGLLVKLINVQTRCFGMFCSDSSMNSCWDLSCRNISVSELQGSWDDSLCCQPQQLHWFSLVWCDFPPQQCEVQMYSRLNSF